MTDTNFAILRSQSPDLYNESYIRIFITLELLHKIIPQTNASNAELFCMHKIGVMSLMQFYN